MSEEVKNASNVTVSVPRNALIAAGGALLVGLGVAGGMMLRSPATSQQPDAQASASQATMAEVPQAAASLPKDGTQGAATNATSSKHATATHTQREQRESRHSSSSNSGSGYPSGDVQAQPAVACTNCGVIEAVRAVQQKGQGSGVGAVAGGVLGGVVGNQMGKGSGKTAMTVLGAIGGGLAGNEIEKQHKSVTVYEVRVRMDDGSERTFTRNTEPAPGTRVQVDGNGFHAIDASAEGRPSTMQTSSSGGGI